MNKKMINPPQHWFIFFTGIIGICFFWRTTSITLNSSSILTKASIKLDLSLPTSAILTKRFFNISKKLPIKLHKKKHRSVVSRYMLHLYNRHSNADIVRALQPVYITSALQLSGGGRIIEFKIPPLNHNEHLEAAELMGTAGMIMRVKSIENESMYADITVSRKDETWRAFNVTKAVKMKIGNRLKFLIRGRVKRQSIDNGPILLLSYMKYKKRKSRSINDDDIDDSPSVTSWTNDARRRKKNPCRKKPLYVDFASINYDEWIVAPPGYDAYQCVGKCFFPFGEHLNPTKHAIVQALAGMDGGKPIAKVCCVPTRLAPTSLLYLDATGTLTYQYGYEDMVVVECGCR